MRALQGNAHISLEGNLKRCVFGPELRTPSSETDLLKRSTEWPKLDFVVLPLEEGSVDPILKQILQAGFHDIIHIQIEKDGRIQFGAYDNFHPECVVIGDMVLPEDVLQELVAKHTLRSFGPVRKTEGHTN